jgi:hypothetical protein
MPRNNWGESASVLRQRARVLINRWSIGGAVFTIVVGSLMHMGFAALGKWPPAGVFLPVNESLWEHLKMGYWPVIIFALIEYFPIRPRTGNLWLGTAVTALIATGGTAAFYDAYTYFTRRNLVWADVLSFIIAVILAYAAGAAIMRTREIGLGEFLAVFFIVALGAAFGIFTYMPPSRELFRDPSRDGYGIGSLPVRALLRLLTGRSTGASGPLG